MQFCGLKKEGLKDKKKTKWGSFALLEYDYRQIYYVPFPTNIQKFEKDYVMFESIGYKWDADYFIKFLLN